MSSSLSARRRERDMAEVADGRVIDLLVVGGGVTGAGVALDAASRGLSVALVERADLANGTSRWSSKLVHGGLRYLARGDFGLAMKSACERRHLMRSIAPHLIRAVPMLLPLTDAVSARQEHLARAGHLGGDALRMLSGSSRRSLPGPRRVAPAEALALAPALRREGLRGGLVYWDGQLEDDARLVVALARTAAGHGARILTYCAATEVTGAGAAVRDVRTGACFDLRARHVINATGVWASELEPAVKLRPSRGSHIVVRAARLDSPAAVLTVPVTGERGRYLLVLPQPDGLVYIGLTDEEFHGRLPDQAAVTPAEEQFLLTAASTVLARPLQAADVVGRFAGFRPLLQAAGRTVDLSRRHMVHVAADGMVTVTGGKLTTYRAMAQDAVDRVTDRRCRTRVLPLVGSGPAPPWRAPDVPARLVRRFGSEAGAVVALAGTDRSLLEPVVAGHGVLGVEFLWAVRHEGALTADDLLARRTRLALVPEDAAAARPFAESVLPQTSTF